MSDNPIAVQTLGKALPTKSLDIFHLADATPEAAISYVKRRLDPNFNLDSIRSCIAGLGGRLNDLDLYVSKIQTGVDPQCTLH